MNEKIILFLLGYNKYRDSHEVPFAVSQKGIAEGIDIRVTHIPRAVQKLLNDNYIMEFKTHFRTHLRKRKAYFLTEKGTEKAVALQESIGTQMVTMKASSGNIMEKTMSEMYEVYGGRSNFFDFYQIFQQNKLVDESLLENLKIAAGDTNKILGDEYKDFKYNIPDYSKVIGRSAESEAIESWIISDDHRLLTITGEKGMGKSALAADALKSSQGDFHILWLNLQLEHKWETIVYSLSELATLNNSFKLDKYLKSAGNIIPSKAYEIIAEELVEMKLLIVLDNVHNIDEGFSELGVWLIPLMKSMPEWKVLITSRDPLPVDLRSSTELEGKSTEIKLTGLDSESSRQILNADLSPSEFESIYKYTEGNPLYLKALNDLEASGKLDLKNFRPEELGLLKFLKIQEELE